MRQWLPYGDHRRQDAWIALENFYPTSRGSYRTAPTFAKLGIAGAGPSTPGTTLRAWTSATVDGTVNTVVGTSTKLYVADGFAAGTFTDRSKAGGYSASQWSFAQFGNITIAANNSDNTQWRNATGTSAFADLAGAPKCKHLVVQSNVLLGLGINGAENAWAASDVGDYTNWTTGDAVSSTPILARPGPITAAIAFKDVVLVFKRNAIFQMRYVGSPIMWTVDLICDGKGVVAPGAVCNCGEFVVFSGEHGVTVFDGGSFRDISPGFDSTTLNELFFIFGTDSSCYFPSENAVVFFSVNATLYVYNFTSQRWGKFKPYLSGGSSALTGYAMLTGDSYARYDAMQTNTWQIANSGLCLVKLSADPCVVASQNSWTPAASVFATIKSSYFGDERTKTAFRRVTPVSQNVYGQTTVAATGLSVVPYIGDKPDTVNATAGSAVTSSTGTNRFDVLTTGRYGAFEVKVTGAFYELDDLTVDAVPAGTD